jgi:hypothetical protein
VNFFVGKAVSGKLPPAAVPVKGVPSDADRITWTAKLPPMPTLKGPTDFSVQFVNSFGLSRFATTTIDLLEKDPGKTGPATIKGVVDEFGIKQEGLKVVLTDEKGGVKGEAITDAGGNYAFTDVPPGRYRVSTVKPANGRRAQFPADRTRVIDLGPGATMIAPLALKF